MGTSSKQYVVNDRGARTAVILPAREYQRMLEDLHDLAVVAERREEKTISAAEMRKRLEKHGLL